ncbi:MAG: hypothetical protein ACTSRI_02905 [Promethearchaeota archaeon]
MSIFISWLKKELGYLKDSLPEIVKGFIIFMFISSGLGIAILLRSLGYNGSIIVVFSILIESLSIISCFFIFKKYLRQSNEPKPSELKRKKIK